MIINKKLGDVEIEVRNKYLNDLTLLHFETIGSLYILKFMYEPLFAIKYGFYSSMFIYDDNVYMEIKHDFSNFRSPAPFDMNIIHDLVNNKIFID